MKKILAVFLFLCFNVVQVFAFDLKPIEDDEPTLPSIESIPKLDFSNDYYKQPVSKMYTLKKGTVLELASKSAISDKTKKGNEVKFSLLKQAMTRDGEIIPEGTIFKGTIVDSHPPQMLANGGLVSIKINNVAYKGVTSRINSKVSKVNNKLIFKEDIKGKHLYRKNLGKSMTFGRKVFKAAKKSPLVTSHSTVLNIIGIVPLAVGGAIYAANFALSPVITLFSKGGALNLPAGTVFKIKITEDSLI